MSESNKLADALAGFQAELPKVGKDKTADAGSYKYKYTDLATLTHTVLPVLVKHGLTFMTYPRMTENGYELVGRLMHTSGEMVEGALPIFGRQPQEIGSALSYARRYLLSAMTGVSSDEDDDGARAAKADTTPNKDWDTLADNAETLTDVDELKAFWTREGFSKAPKVIQDRVKAHGDLLKKEQGE